MLQYCVAYSMLKMDYNNFNEFIQWYQKLIEKDTILEKHHQITIVLADIAAHYLKPEIYNDEFEYEYENSVDLFKIWSSFTLNLPIVHQIKHITEKSLQTIQTKIARLYPVHELSATPEFTEISIIYKLLYNFNNTKTQSVKMAALIDIESLIVSTTTKPIVTQLILGKLNKGISYDKYIRYLNIQQENNESARIVLNLLLKQ